MPKDYTYIGSTSSLADRSTVTCCSMAMDKKTLIFALSNLGIICLMGLLAGAIHIFGTPFQRGFYCNDESISYPYNDSTIPFWLAVLVGGAIFIVSIVVVERVQMKKQFEESSNDDRYVEGLSCSSELSRFLVSFTRYFFLAIFGHLVTEIITVSCKMWFGRQRPHFMALCRPDMSSPLYNCSTYISVSVCRPENAAKLEDAQLSFPSGHASFSMFAVVYACLYIQARATFSKGHLLLPFLQLLFLLWGIYVCCSRVSDYKHHWSDVFGGGLLGTLVALLTGLKIKPSYVNCFQTFPSAEETYRLHQSIPITGVSSVTDNSVTTLSSSTKTGSVAVSLS